jgi:sulfatase maturation enzyme AslB (radical SAM superfamily)
MFEAYVTNVCNLNCSECNRLNNYKFSGHYLWSDVEEDYKRWSEKIDPGWINILGGEPLLNLDIPNWIIGLRQLWPDTTINLLTNGTSLHLHNNLYSLLKDNNITVRISTHSRTRHEPIINQVTNLLANPVSKTYEADMDDWVNAYNQVKDLSWPLCSSYTDFDTLPEYIKDECTNIHKIDIDTWKKEAGHTILIDKNNVKVYVTYGENFVTSPLKYKGDDSFAVYDSDKELAHSICISKYCTELVDGKLYKCHHVALLPKFMEQYQVNISPEDKELLLSYRPLESTATIEETKAFIDNLSYSIPQCKLCPESYINHANSTTSTDKIKIKKLVKIVSTNK